MVYILQCCISVLCEQSGGGLRVCLRKDVSVSISCGKSGIKEDGFVFHGYQQLVKH